MRRWAAARPLAVREAPSRQTSVWREACQISVRREACPPARRPRRELRSARRLEARPGPAGLAPPSDRATMTTGTADTSPAGLAPPPIGQSHPMSGTKLSPHETRRIEPVQNSPHTPQNGDTKPFLACRENFVPLNPPTSRAGRTLYRTQDHLRDKTLPTRNPAGRTGIKLSQQATPMGPPGTKLSQHTTKRLYQAISRLQGELCTAQSTNKPSRENFVPHTGPPPGQNSPHTKPGGPNRYKTLPAGSPNGPPGTKLSQHTTKRRYQAISRLQGELFHAYGRGKPSRENFVPHTGPLAGQNSPRSTHQPKQRDKTLPARHKTLILACFTHAGRVLSRI